MEGFLRPRCFRGRGNEVSWLSADTGIVGLAPLEGGLSPVNVGLCPPKVGLAPLNVGLGPPVVGLAPLNVGFGSPALLVQ